MAKANSSALGTARSCEGVSRLATAPAAAAAAGASAERQDPPSAADTDSAPEGGGIDPAMLEQLGAMQGGGSIPPGMMGGM